AAVLSEALVVACGIALTPRGVFDRRLVRTLLLALVSGGVMAVVSRLLHPFMSPFVSAPIAVVAYGLALWGSGGLEKEQIARIKGFVARKLARAR
ncbi:MAG: hypothetical protein ABJB12_22580, partial [Pseudomonadota bacterium]